MKEMNKIDRYTDKEWEELASLLSDEKKEQSDLLNQFMDDDSCSTANKWNEIRNMNSEKEINVDKAWERVSDRINSEELKTNIGPARIRYINSAITRVAAVALILLALGISGIYLNNAGFFSKKNVIATNSDQKNVQVELPDGSKIFLNRDTELSYRTNFGKNNREVTLRGEAFFEITADPSNPFLIDAGDASVKVVGTSFNVITKNSSSAVEVYVKTGKVVLSDNSGTKSIILDPEFIGIMDSKTSDKTVNKDPNYLSWKTGFLQYNGQKLDVVFHDLKRVYNMDIIADNPEILEYPWTSPIDNQSQDNIIRLICASFNLNFTKDGNVYHLKTE